MYSYALCTYGDGMPHGAPKSPTTLRLDPQLKKAAVRLAGSAGKSLTDLVEEGLRLVVDRSVRRLRPSVAVERHRGALLDIVRRHGAANPRIFGSVARGEDDKESDLDLLVDRLPGTGLMKLAELQLEAETLLGLPVHVHTPEGLKDEIHAVVMQEVRPL
jgi:predicted nucleotidyltransferase